MRRRPVLRPAAVAAVVLAIGVVSAVRADEPAAAAAQAAPDAALPPPPPPIAEPERPSTTTSTPTSTSTTTATSTEAATSTAIAAPMAAPDAASTPHPDPLPASGERESEVAPAPTATPTQAPTATATEIAPLSLVPAPPLPPPPLPESPAPRPAIVVASLPVPSQDFSPPPSLSVPPARPAATRSGFRFAIDEDNDGITALRPRTDEFYTQGLRLSARWPTSVSEDGSESQLGFAVGQEIYTPSNLRTTDLAILKHDRPYAGWLYASMILRTVETAPGLKLGADAGGPGEGIVEIESSIGVTGPQSEAGALQTWFHEQLARNGVMPRGRSPAGWGVYQVRNQLTLDTAVRFRFDALQASGWLGAFTRGTGSVLALRVSPKLGLRVGSTFDSASLGLEVRTGLIASPAVSRARLPFELWLFGGADGSYVGYDALIEGPLRGGVTTDVSRVPWVATAEAGAGLRLGSFEIAYREQWQSPQITPTPPGARRIHHTGRVTVAFGGR